MDRLQIGDARLSRRRQRVVGAVHIHILRVAATVRQSHREQHRRLGRTRVVGVIGVIALARDISRAVREFILVGDVVNGRAFRQREAGVVLNEHLADQLHGLQHLMRVHLLVPHHQHGMIREGLIQPRARVRVHRFGEIDAGRFDTGMIGQFRQS